ncbi:MAG: homoserine O-acetyltransferase [Candidatus Aminicenantes bacterium]|nr:homoserine O-acetyltransferase [Candidatus Aminicenantes bacterium]
MSEYCAFDKNGKGVGLVERKSLTFAHPPDEIVLESGVRFGPVTLAYETYGRLNETKDNVILVCHALSGSAHAAGYHSEIDAKPGWWDNIIGPDKGIDTNRFFVICSNIIGSCYGSTGPGSLNPNTGREYGLDFPLFTMADIVKTQKCLLDNLGIRKILAAVGGSIGGMQAMEWAVSHPDMVASVIPIASTCKRSALSIGLSEAQRQAIMADSNWRGGRFYGKTRPEKGLALARMIGHLSYLSEGAMQRKFGRRLMENNAFKFDFSVDFQVENYLHMQGKKFVERFDANSYLYITKASDYFDLGDQKGEGSLVRAFSRTNAKFLVISFTSDWLYPTSQSKEMVQAMKKAGLDVSFCELETENGHDSFLLAHDQLSRLISGFISRVDNQQTQTAHPPNPPRTNYRRRS